ncbi:MAG: thiamine biosynthesis protein ThiF, partial [Glaciecola sp.]
MTIDTATPAYRVLDISRYAPSGDNIQPWKFKLVNDTAFEVHLTDCADWMIYDKLTTSSFLALGALFEYIDIAAAEFGYAATYTPVATDIPHKHIYYVALSEQDTVKSDLFDTLTTRTVQRKSMGTQALSVTEREQLMASLPDGFSVQLYESEAQRKAYAKLLFENSYTRYAMPEGYHTHAEAIDWRKGYEQLSPIKIPPKALGINPIMVALTKVALSSWGLFHVIEKYLFGLILPRYLMDYVAVVKSTAVFVLTCDKTPTTQQDTIDSGRAMVRFWLMANKLGLGFQPQYTPVLFAEYLRANLSFTSSKRALKRAKKINATFKQLAGDDVVERSVFMGRLGRTPAVNSRSTRLTVAEL